LPLGLQTRQPQAAVRLVASLLLLQEEGDHAPYLALRNNNFDFTPGAPFLYHKRRPEANKKA